MIGKINSISRMVAVSAFFTLFNGCMVGPNFHSPPLPGVSGYTKPPLPKKTVSTSGIGTSGKSQYFVHGEDIPGAWWYLFHSKEINCLIAMGLANNQTLEAAKETLVQARETLNAQIASLTIPAVGAQFTGQRQRFSNQTVGFPGSSVFSLYNASVNVSYTLDFFGSARRTIESGTAQMDNRGFELEGAYITLTSNIVTTAITIASLKAQIQATEELIRLQQNQLGIVNKQFQLGGASGSDVLTQESQVAQTVATLPPLQQNLAKSLHALSILIGEFPSDSQLPELNLNKIDLPTHLPISIPSMLVRQRPDVRAAEALLHSACAQIGIATANLFPQINLTGSYGWTNTSPAPINLFNSGNAVWSYGGQLLQPIFNGGALQAQKRAVTAAFNVARAQYKQTVLQAFQNVADTLRALENDARTLRAQHQAEMAANDSLRITQRQYRLGGVSYLTLLTSQRQYQQAKIGRIQAEAARYTDTAALFQALGGGWWNRDSCTNAYMNARENRR